MAAPLSDNLLSVCDEEYIDNVFEDDELDVDMQIDDLDDDLVATPSAPRGDLNSSPTSSSSMDADDLLLNPNSNPCGVSPLQPLPISSSVPTPPPDAKRHRTDHDDDGHHQLHPLVSSSTEDSRKLFQRLWTDEDEIAILKGFDSFTSQRGTAHHAHQHDTGPFYEQIKATLQLDFTKNQLVEKIRRLKKKYRSTLARMASSPGGNFPFKSHHDRATFELSRKIWSPASVESVESIINADAAEAVPVDVKSIPALTPTTTPIDIKPTPEEIKSVNGKGFAIPDNGRSSNVAEEIVRSCLSPLLKELLSCTSGGGGGYATVMPIGLLGNFPGVGKRDGISEGKWRKQQILELEVYSKRLELVQEQVKVALDELHSMEAST